MKSLTFGAVRVAILLTIILFPIISPTDDGVIIFIVLLFGGGVGWVVGQGKQTEKQKTIVSNILNWTLGIIIGAIGGWTLGAASGGIMMIFLGNTIFGMFTTFVGWNYGRRIRSQQIDFSEEFMYLPFWVVVGIVEVIAVGLLMTGFKPCGWLDSSLQLTGCRHDTKIYGYDFPKLTFVPESNTLALIGGRDSILYLDANNLQSLSTINWDKKRIQTLAFSPDSSLLALGDFNGLVGIFRAIDGEPVHILQSDESTFIVKSIAFSPDGMLLASAKGSLINLWEVSSGNLLQTIYQDGYDDPNSLAFSPDETLLVSGSDSGAIRLWQTSDSKLVKTFQQDPWGVTSVVLSPDGDILAASSADGKIRLWQISDGTLLQVLTGHKYDVRSITFSPDGLMLASGSGDTTVRIWQVSDGSLLKILRHGFGGITKEGVWSVIFSPDGKSLVTSASEPPLASRVRQFKLK